MYDHLGFRVLFIYFEIIIALKGFLKSLADGEGEFETLTGGKYFEMFTTHYFQALMVFFFIHTHSEKYKTTMITDVVTHFT